MSELTLVTSFFDIGRNDWQGFSRGNEQYVSRFKHWARMKNKLIIYAEPKIIDEIQSVRENYGLLDRTSIIPISDVNQIDPELYDALRTAMIQKESWRFHKGLINPESWNYHYNYIMALKIFWVKDAVARGLTDGMSAWIDFGYDHGGRDFPYSEDFDFLWQYDFSHNIHSSRKRNWIPSHYSVLYRRCLCIFVEPLLLHQMTCGKTSGWRSGVLHLSWRNVDWPMMTRH